MKDLIGPILLFPVLFFFCGCHPAQRQQADRFGYDSFRETGTLTGSVVTLDPDLISEGASRIAVVDSLLFLLDYFGNYLVNVYDLNNQMPVGGFLTIGRGSNEVTTTGGLNFNTDRSRLLIDDPNLRKILVYDINDRGALQKGQFFLPERAIEYGTFADDPTLLSTGEILMVKLDMFARERFVFIDQSGAERVSTGDFPAVGNIRESAGLSAIFEFHYVISEERERIVVFNRFTDLIEIFGLDGRRIETMHGPDGFLPVYRVDGGEFISVSLLDGQARRAYTRPVAAGEEIWVLYSGELIDDSNSYNKLMVFDWDAAPLRFYELPCNLVSFDVDIYNGLVYGLSLDGDAARIISFAI